MSTEQGFDVRAEPAVHNAKLQAAVALATGRLLTNRAAAIGELTDSDALRDPARRIRAHTLGRLDETALFYLRSRGLPAADARRLLVQAFLREPLAMLGDETLAERLGDRLAARLDARGARP